MLLYTENINFLKENQNKIFVIRIYWETTKETIYAKIQK